MIERIENKNFISVEGVDSVGKTTFCEWMRIDLSNEGKNVIVTSDPPRTIYPWSNFREYFQQGERIARFAEAHLLLTARLDNYERVIRPALQEGQIVIADRFSDSWLAYQSIRLAPYFGSSRNALEYLISAQDNLVSYGLLTVPGLTLWIVEDPAITMSRSEAEGKKSKYENLPMQKLVTEQYEELSKRFVDRIMKIHANNQDINAVYFQVIGQVRDYLGK